MPTWATTEIMNAIEHAAISISNDNEADDDGKEMADNECEWCEACRISSYYSPLTQFVQDVAEERGIPLQDAWDMFSMGIEYGLRMGEYLFKLNVQ